MEEINIRVCIEEYMRIEPEHNSELRKYLSKSIWTPSDRQSILDVLSTEVIVAHKTNSVASQFPTVLLELLHRIKQKVESYISDGSGSFSKDGYAFHQRFCCVIGVLLPFNTDVLNFARSYMLSHPPIFEKLMVSRLPDVSTPKKRKVSKRLNCCQPSTVEILSATLSIVRHLADHIIPEWDWSVIYDFLYSEDQSVKWFVCNIVAMVTKMTDAERNMYLCSNFEVDELKSLIVRHELCSIPRLIPRISDQESDSVDENDDVIKTHTLNSITPADLSPQVVCISGVLLSKYHNQTTPTEEHSELELVRVPSTNYHLRSLALAVSSGTPVLLEGPVGCGKTSLVEYLALITGRLPSMLTKVQIADQTDSKSLLGMYCCSDTPGEFVWRPGCITQAMINGAWILLEDVDLAPVDVLSTLIPILESKTMTLPGRSEIIKAAPGFHVFATQRILISSSGSYTNTASSLSIVDQLWTKIRVEPLSESELLRVISVKWPELQSVQDRILQVYLMVSKGQHAVTSNDSDKTDVMSDSLMSDNAGRLISTRDLMKWCRRICHEFDVSSLAMAELVFQDALDCFCSCISSKSAMKASATKLGASLNIVSTKVEFFCNKYKPNIMKFDDHVVIGRANLAMNIDRYSPALSGVNTRTFSFTRPATELLEKISVAVVRQEPVLLVGETGTGKTHCVQYLSELTGHKLFVINMNQQSDSSDLLGGYKPVDCKLIVAPVKEKFDDIFYRTFSRHQNSKFLGHITKMFLNHRWCDLVKLMTHPIQAAIKRLCQSKLSSEKELHLDWIEFEQRLPQLVKQLKHAETSLAFSFIEGTLVKALKAGNWVLLDEINLAEADTLQCLSGILESSIGSVSLIERGDDRPINRHKDFRLFACMNPATDVGKKDLPTGIRNRFTEFFVAELTEKSDLITLVESYLKGLSPTSSQVSGIVRFYLHVKKAAVEYLVDGTGHSPHYSLRTLCRALSYAAGNPCGNVARSLYEAFCVSFLTQLDRSSHPLMESLIRKFILKGVESKVIIKKSLPEPPGGHHVQFERYWILCGDKTPHVPDDYILTPSVRLNLGDLSRVVSARRFPVLLQGETSVGKTSLIQWLAQSSGNYCVRVNNHEHTDIQEYVGSYTADDSGKLVFQEGVLVRAMRNGYWIILDELNLAPTEVLEALNRVLDDNKELFIAETQTVVKAHPKFMLFATQNPPGQYGGRKVLSRAFRNRFVELHFDTIPTPELETILSQRCEIPLSYCKKMVAIMNELQVRRRSSGVFAGKQGYITLRDLFRWAERYRQASQQIQKFYDWDQHLAEEGYMLLAGRVRRQEECDVILEVIEKHMKRKIDESRLFSLSSDSSIVDALTKKLLDYSSSHLSFKHIVWVRNLQRLAVLVGQALRFGEPVLIVGETGCGKTTLCQLFADLKNQKLHSVNCHMHCESSDFLGGLRPVRDHDNSDDQSLFEWVDGPLVNAMRCGDVFLADEISLADDSVLERLNSVLESERTLRLTEKSFDPLNDDNSDLVIADKNFRFVATMNPGGDYGKKELSPALRDRFTEIWCPSTFTAEDLISIVEHNVNKEIRLSTQSDEITSGFGRAMVEFIAWFSNNTKSTRRIISVRDILSWTSFVNTICDNGQNNADRVDPAIAYFHGACLVFVDSVNSGASGNFRSDCIKFLVEQINRINGFDISQSINPCNADVIRSENYFGIQPFFIPTGSEPRIDLSRIFTFQAPTTNSNLTKVMRALQVQKAILLEGSPGVGKTTLISALAAVAGHKLVRINLSEQTDISDLFGSDLPVDGGKGGQFSWADGPFLQALKSGHWIILDELNLASQSVLEGLNACLDHRGEVFIPELGKSFCLQSRTTRLFASQNPMNQGGSRKGLPQSFLNRFSQVYIDPLSSADLVFIMEAMFPDIPAELVHKMVGFNNQLTENLVGGDSIRKKWEFNLRDLSRWCEIMKRKQNEDAYNPGNFVQLIYGDRMQTRGDKSTVHDLYERVFGEDYPLRKSNRNFVVTRNVLQVGQSFLSRSNVSGRSYSSSWRSSLCVLNRQLDSFESLMLCLEMGWMAILVGNEGTGKSSMIHALSQLTGHQLDVITVNSSMDTGDLLGGFEQTNLNRHLDEIGQNICLRVEECLRKLLMEKSSSQKSWISALFRRLYEYRSSLKMRPGMVKSTETESKEFTERIELLGGLLSQLEQRSPNKEVEDLKSKLDGVAKRADEQETINRCGTFEWIDSTLVRALQNGRWLLIENANFCSPSVLDRLNGLLEPRGTLTIGERGVIDGHITTITPHVDFRLILTMNPNNGEISRAMRNRGIEIYSLNEVQAGSYSDVDLRALLTNLGLTCDKLKDLMILTHHTIAKQDFYMKRSCSIVDLLHSASLLTQQLRRGIPLRAAIRNSFDDVYVLCHGNFDVRKEVVDIITATVANFDFDGVCNSDGFISMYPTEPTVCELSSNSVLANVRHQGSLFAHLLYYLANRVASEQRSSNYGLSKNHLTAIGYFVERASFDDWELRLAWISRNLPNTMTTSLLPLVNKIFSDFFNHPLVQQTRNEMLKLDVVDSECTPIDLRWNSDLIAVLRNERGSRRIDEQLSNMALLWNRCRLCFEFLARANMFEEASRWRENINDISLSQISRSIKQSESVLQAVPHPVLIYLDKWTKTFEREIFNMASNERTMTDDILLEILDAMKWFWYLREVCNEPVSRSELGEQIHRLTIHWAWFLKYTVPCIESHTRFAEETVILTTKMNKHFSLDSRIVDKIRSTARKTYGCPAPFANKKCCEVFSYALRLLEHLRFDSSSPTMERTFHRFKLAANRPEIYRIIAREMVVLSSNPSEAELLHAEDNLFGVHEELVKNGIIDQDHPTEADLNRRTEGVTDEIPTSLTHDELATFQLVPLKIYLDARMCYDSVNRLVRRKTCRRALQPNSNPLLIRFNALLDRFQDSGIEPRPCPSEIYLEHHLFLSRCPSPSETLRYIDGTSASNQSTVSKNRHASNICDAPMLSIYCSCLLSSGAGQDDVPVSVGNVVAKKNQFSTLSSCVWNSSISVGGIRSKDVSLAASSATELLDVIGSVFGELLVPDQKDFDERHSLPNLPAEFASYGLPADALNKVSELLNARDESVGLLWACIGLVRMHCFAPSGLVDPAVKKQIKSDRRRQEYEERLLRFQMYDYVAVNSTGLPLNRNVISKHPIIADLISKFNDSKGVVGSISVYRPSSAQYQKMVTEVRQYLRDIGSERNVYGEIVGQLTDGPANETAIAKASTWINSSAKFLRRLSENYTAYRDLLVPFLSGICEMIHGVKNLIHRKEMLLRWSSADDLKSAEDCITSLTKFPVFCESTPTLSALATKLMEHADTLTSKNMLCSETLDSFSNNLSKSALSEIVNHIGLVGCLERESVAILQSIIEYFTHAWMKQEEARRRNKAKDEAWFEHKAEDEAENFDADVSSNFPTFHEDFADLTERNVLDDDDDVKCVSEAESGVGELSDQDMLDVFLSYETVIVNMTRTRWLKVTPTSANVDLITSYEQRLDVAGNVIRNNYRYFDSKLDKDVICATIFRCRALTQSLLPDDEKDSSLNRRCKRSPHDIYRDADVPSALLCRSVLDGCRGRVEELLVEFPDHPSLKKIVAIIDRVFSFPITSSVMRLVTGLETALATSQEWEANAHRGVSLRQHLENVTELILKFRKMELNDWSSRFDNALYRHETRNVGRWWCHLIEICDAFLLDAGGDTSLNADIIDAFKQFIEGSSVGEFNARLRMLFALHCHLIHKPESSNQRLLIAVTWNLRQFYRQFLPQVDERIDRLKAPIVKDLKDFIKIARWNDINYWAVRQSSVKTHRTLQKHVKEFENRLSTPVNTVFVEKKDVPSDESKNPSAIAIRPELFAFEDQSAFHDAESKKWSEKFRKVSVKIMNADAIPTKIDELNEVTADIVETVHQLQRLEVDRGVSKEKQTNEAKNIDLRKRKALSELFRTLRKLGLSYRKGQVVWNSPDCDQSVLLPPLDVTVNVSDDGIGKCVLGIWEGCEKHFLRCVLRRAALKKALVSPSKDLGPDNIQRCAGFSSRLFDSVRKQRKKLGDVHRCLTKFEEVLAKLSDLVGDPSRQTLPPQKTSYRAFEDLRLTGVQLFEFLHQFQILIRCRPPKDGTAPVLAADHSENSFEHLDDVSLIAIEDDVSALIKEIEPLVISASNYRVFVPADVRFLDGTLNGLRNAREKLKAIRSRFVRDDLDNCFSESLSFVLKASEQWLTSASIAIELVKDKMDDDRIGVEDEKRASPCGLEQKLIDFRHSVFLAVQNVYKRQSRIPERSEADDVEPLIKLLYENTDVFSKLGIENMERELTAIIGELVVVSDGEDGSELSSAVRSLVDMLPVLRQYVRLVRYHFVVGLSSHRTLSTHLSVLLGLFVELGQKGFCLPPDIGDDMEQQEGGTQFQDIEDGGLGEGDGQKDVSDQIKSEDQLDDTMKQGDDKPDEDQESKSDVKEEDNGIEMSEDFESKAQDLPENDDDGDDDDDEEEDVDKQMGDVDDDDADKLDDKVWGSDNEDDERPDGEDKGGAGKEEKSRSELAAKDDDLDGETERNDEEPVEDVPEDVDDDRQEYDGEIPDSYKEDQKPAEAEEEPMDLPDDLEVDANEIDDTGEDAEDENPSEDVDGDEFEKEVDDEPIQEDQSGDNNEKTVDREDGDENDEDDEPMEVTHDEVPPPCVDTSAPTAVQTLTDHTGHDAVADDQAAGHEKDVSDAADTENSGDDRGTGQAKLEQGQQGHDGCSVQSTLDAESMKERRSKGKSSEDRSLGSGADASKLNVANDESENRKDGRDESKKSNTYEHVKDGERHDTETLDTATEQQAEQRAAQHEDADNPDEDGMTKPEEDEASDEKRGDDVPRLDELKVDGSASRLSTKFKSQSRDDAEVVDDEREMDVDGEFVVSIGESKWSESTIHTKYDLLNRDEASDVDDARQLQSDMQEKLSMARDVSLTNEQAAIASRLWMEYAREMSPLVQQLCEQLRLVLEPSLASKLKGDYRSGKRLNMRKVIPYIASQFRQDKIWLRRTKPSKRNYQIVLAVDDSSSMSDNQSKKLAFQSIAVISKALQLLEAGQLSVVSFGEDIRLLHPFDEQFTDDSGAKILHSFTFAQTKTKVGELLKFVTPLMSTSRSRMKPNRTIPVETSQLLLIISDGRGLFYEGQKNVEKAVRMAKHNNVFVVFVVLDNPNNKDSIMDIKVPVFKDDGQIPEIRSYMETFPFPFYLILRDIESMPRVLSESLRQWFELVAKDK